jgi:hypothetical protein
MSMEHMSLPKIVAESNQASRVNPKIAPSAAHPFLQMQQNIGNQGILQLLRIGQFQTKLTVGQPNDTYEQEADQLADQVMRMPDPVVQSQSPEEEETLHTSPLAGKITPLIQRQSPKEEEEPLQAKAASETASTVDSNVEGNINNLRGGGQPLPEPVRNYFEPRFGYDFSQVRVHTDSKAADTAQAVNAKAFTLGQDIVFNTGQYSPEHEEGKKLIAHELTHVVQQTGKKD